MSQILIPISDFEFKNNVNIRFNNILDGFNLFENFTIDASNIEDGEKLLIKFIEEVFEKNNSEAYIDFYIAKLSNEDRSRLVKLISGEIITLNSHVL